MACDSRKGPTDTDFFVAFVPSTSPLATMHQFISAILCLCFCLQFVKANHVPCSWVVDTESDKAWQTYCSAYAEDIDNPPQTPRRKAYYCKNTRTKVGDFNVQGAGVLEQSKPCGDHGYASGKVCNLYKSWAICLFSETEDKTYKECRAYYGHDDCFWSPGGTDAPALFDVRARPR